MKLGPYEIVGPLGAGGMGEVYQARDTRLDRLVAIKTLPADLAGDLERRHRMEREARAIAALNHPHICTLHDIGDYDGVAFLVMELVEGTTLAARLERGPLPLDEALTCAEQIADALARAHQQGIVHRDLKPGNIMLTGTSGSRRRPITAKLLDFGLAMLRAERPIAGEGPTVTEAMTRDGQILGTLQYMAPEQLEGRHVDARADIFAFGAVLFEMIAGRRPFGGSNPASIIGAILHTDPPPITQVQPGAPRALDRLLSICLAKNPDDRWSSMHDVLLQLRAIAEDAGRSEAGSAPSRTSLERLAWAVAAVATLAALSLALVAWSGRDGASTADRAIQRLSVLPPEGSLRSYGEAPQISPDGRRLAFVARDSSGRTRLYVRELAGGPAQPVTGTDYGAMPFWAPDSRRLGFFAQGHLKTVAIDGGSPSTLAPAPVPRGGTWNQDDVIVFVAMPNRLPLRIAAAGGEAETILAPPDSATFRWFPKFLPDGRHYLYLESGPRLAAERRVKVASLDNLETHELVRTAASAVYAEPGYVLFRRERTLVAQPFDTRALRLTGAPVPLAEDVGINALTYEGLFSASTNGVVAYDNPTPGSQITWFDREGRQLSPATPPGDQNNFCLSSDESRIVYEVADGVTGNIDLWAISAGNGVPWRLTFDPAIDFYPVCSPRGDEVVFASLRGGPPALFRVAVDSPGSERLLLELPGPLIPTDWSHDGRFIVYSVLSPDTSWDVVVLSLADGARMAVAATRAEERNARLSPDNRWIAYTSNESGQFEVYVQPFPATGAKWQVSRGGGSQPQWSADGRGLYYLAPDSTLHTRPVTAGPSTIAFGELQALMKVDVLSWEPVNQSWQYAVTADGRRVLVNAVADRLRSISLVLNWRHGSS
jgi:eukaryotic-like serine/threonine-protein kinase